MSDDIQTVERRRRERRTTARAPDTETLIDDNPKLRLCIGRRLGAVRKAKNIGQAEVATAVGVSRPHLSNIELGRSRTSWSGLRAIAEYYQLGLSDLIANCSAQLAGEPPQQPMMEQEPMKGIQTPEMLTDDERFMLGLLRLLATDEQRRIATDILDLVKARSQRITNADKKV